jgi:Tfp pilus assembly protein FimT
MHRRTLNKARTQYGFYLYELLLVAIISGIFLVMASAGFRGWWLPMQAEKLRQLLQESLHSSAILARQLQHTVQLCGISDHSGCDNDWSKGWVVTDMVSHQELDSQSLSGRLSLVWKGGLGWPVAFSPTGRPDGVQGGWHCGFDGRELFHLVLRRVM